MTIDFHTSRFFGSYSFSIVRSDWVRSKMGIPFWCFSRSQLPPPVLNSNLPANLCRISYQAWFCYACCENRVLASKRGENQIAVFSVFSASSSNTRLSKIPSMILFSEPLAVAQNTAHREIGSGTDAASATSSVSTYLRCFVFVAFRAPVSLYFCNEMRPLFTFSYIFWSVYSEFLFGKTQTAALLH